MEIRRTRSGRPPACRRPAALLRDIEDARSTVHVAVFLFFRDPIGEEVAQALAREAVQGVRVRVLLNLAKTHMGDPFSTDEKEMMRHDPSFHHDPTDVAPLCAWMRERGIEVVDTIDYDRPLALRDPRLRAAGADPRDHRGRRPARRPPQDRGPRLPGRVQPPTTGPRGRPIAKPEVLINEPDDQPNQVRERYVELILLARESIFIENPYLYHPAVVNALVQPFAPLATRAPTRGREPLKSRGVRGPRSRGRRS